MKFLQRVYGGLRCQTVDALPEEGSPKLAVVFCHGFGAPGTDLVGLGPELMQSFDRIAANVRFIFPAAPLSLDDYGIYGGRAWWYLDLEARMQAIARGEIRNLRNDVPEGLREARESMLQLIADVSSETGLPTPRIVVGGFSQGGMIATDVALHLDESPAALVVFSGTILNEPAWRAAAPKHAGLKTVLSHGRQDPILPFLGAEWLRDLLKEGGLDVEFHPFNGGHTIPRDVLARVGELVDDLAMG